MTDEFGALPARSLARDPRGTRPGRLCAPFLEQLPVTGVSISVFDRAGRQSTICASDATAARLDELQFELGEGPHWDALHGTRPVLVADITEGGRWPVFSTAAAELPVGALFAFPMVMGAVTVGVVDLYRSPTGEIDARDVARAIALTHRVTRPAVQQALVSAEQDIHTESPAAPAMRREVHQATGMILVQLNTNATEAFFLLRAHAFASGRSVQDVAHDVVARRLDFSILPE